MTTAPALIERLRTWRQRAGSGTWALARKSRRLAQRLLRPTAYRLAQVLPSPLPAAPPVTVVGFISASTGLGEAARGTITALQRMGHPVSYIDTEPAPTLVPADLPPNARPTAKRAVNLLHVNAANVQQTYKQMQPGFFAGKINIGFWFWEMPSFPERWYGAFSLFDEVWVASRYTQSALSAIAPVPVVHMRTLVEPAMPAQIARARWGMAEGRFVFLFSFDACSIVERKNPWSVIHAFRQAFGAPATGPLLVLKINNSDLATKHSGALGLPPTYIAELAEGLQSVNGILVDQRVDRAATSALMSACDCYVSLHRCEGFGLTMAEAMYFGKPCIATGYSGNIDFMTPSNSYLAGYRLVTLQQDWKPYQAGDFWADPDIAHAAALMHQVYTQPEEAAARGRQAAEDIRRDYSAAVVGQGIQRRLQLLTLRRTP